MRGARDILYFRYAGSGEHRMENTQKQNPIDREKLRREDEKLRKDVAEVDASLKTMEDFSSP